MENTYITSDLHFFHKNLTRYCEKSRGQWKEDIGAMNEYLLQQIDALPAGSTIYNLGDIMMDSSKTVEDLRITVQRMKSNDKKLKLVMGNHDRFLHKYLKGAKQLYKSSYELLKDVGFDEVYKYPILLEGKYLLSHEPVYLSKGSNIINIMGHIHDTPMDKDYFNRECENWAMMERVKKEGVSKQTNLDIDTSVKDFGKEIDLVNYKCVCWDLHTRILDINEVLS